MPEGPEVKVITEELNYHSSNKLLKNFEVLGGRFIKNPIENLNEFKENLPLKINSVNCKGKFIWFDLENNWSIWNTLGMSGGWKINQEKHSHIKLSIEDRDLWFTDTRRFGTIKITNKPDELKKKLNSIVPGALFEISKSDEKKLDVYEDFPVLYKKIYFKYYSKKVMTYSMNRKTKFRYPTERYLNVVKRGYKDCKLDPKYLKVALQTVK